MSKDDKDLADVRNNPEWTAETFARSKSFAEVFPALARNREVQKAAKKRAISIRLDESVIDHFKATGEGWQARINEALLKAVRKPKV